MRLGLLFFRKARLSERRCFEEPFHSGTWIQFWKDERNIVQGASVWGRQGVYFEIERKGRKVALWGLTPRLEREARVATWVEWRFRSMSSRSMLAWLDAVRELEPMIGVLHASDKLASSANHWFSILFRHRIIVLLYVLESGLFFKIVTSFYD